MALCNRCNKDGLSWHEVDGKWKLKDGAGNPHFCEFVNKLIEFTPQTIITCPTCNIKISIAGLKKRIERVKAESEALSGQDCGFEGLDKPEEIARACCINPECKGIGYVIV
jgi:DNA-directed RNA polymerase subunit RPC12/RpoP